MTGRQGIGTVLLVALLLLPVLAQAQEQRSLPFNKQTVYNYFRRVEDVKRDVPENIRPADYQRQMCLAYVRALKQTGYDFEATVQNAVRFAERGNHKLNDPRFLFLIGVFQYPPDVFVKHGLLSKETGDAVMAYLKP